MHARRLSLKSRNLRSTRPMTGLNRAMTASRVPHGLVAALAGLGLFGLAAVSIAAPASSPAAVDASRLTSADRDPANWMTYVRAYNEQRFSPLALITADNVKQLGLAWYADLDSVRGQEVTPLVIDGVLYVSTAWSIVKAYDAKTGGLLWSFDPLVPRELGVRGCCDVVNRGVAAWKGKIFVGTFDGRLVALDAQTGKQVWSVMTVDPTKPYTITQAPRVVKGRVVIGNSGSEYGVWGLSRRTMPRLATLYGDSIPFQEILPSRSKVQFSRKLRKPGMANGGSSGAAEPCGKGSPTTPSSTSSISASATGLNGIRASAAQARVTTGFSHRSWPSMRIQGNMHGISRPRPERNGTLMRSSNSSWPT